MAPDWLHRKAIGFKEYVQGDPPPPMSGDVVQKATVWSALLILWEVDIPSWMEIPQDLIISGQQPRDPDPGPPEGLAQ